MNKRILFDTLKSQKNIFYARIGAELASSLLVVAAAWKTASVVNLVFIEGRGSAETAPELTVLFLCLLVMALLRVPSARLERRLSDAARLSCRRQLHAALLSERHDVSGLLTLALERVDALDQYFRTVLPTAISFAVLVPLILIVAAILDPLSALLFLATLPIAPFLLYLIGRATRRASEQQWDEMSRLTSGFGELIRAAMTLKIFHRTDAEGEHLARMSRSFSEASLHVLRLAFISSFALELITTLSIALIAVSIGLRLVEGMMDFWTAFFVLILAPLFYQPLREGGIAFHAAMEAKTAEEALRPYLSRTAPADGAQSRVLSPPALAAANLTYRYPLTEETVLTRLSLTFPAGKRTVLAGASGTGKTTLLTLLAGLAAPTEGSVQISDGAGADHAFDLATLSEKTKCALISYVPQEPHIFSATLAENVTLWQDNRSPEDAAAALEGAALGDFLRALPQGLDTLLGAGRHPLSAGQRHRLGIARALCAARPIVLLDEPTAGLDAETEEHVLRTLTEFAHRRTLIVSSHRPAVMAWADHTITLGGET